MRVHKLYILSIALFAALSVIAVIPGVVVVIMIATLPLLGAPAFVLLAAPTVLIYALAIFPLVVAPTAPYRWGTLALIVIGLALPAALAIGPAWVSEPRAAAFAARMSVDDVSKAAAEKPRRIELAGDQDSGLFKYNEGIGDKAAACQEICTRLLFNGEADWVRMTKTSGASNDTRKTGERSVTYHIEHRDLCPEAGPGSGVNKVIRDRLVAGDCLIAEPENSEAADAVVKFTTLYSGRSYPPAPHPDAPKLVRVESVKRLRITSREHDAPSLLRQQTETIALSMAKPFYVGADIQMQNSQVGPTFGRHRLVTDPIDLINALRETLHYEIAAIAPPASDGIRTVAERILATPIGASPTFSTQQQDVLVEALSASIKQANFSSADIEFVRRMIADERVTNNMIPIHARNLFRRDPELFRPLIPVVLNRMGGPVGKNAGSYESSLGWALGSFSGDDLRPYRDQMIRITAAQPGSFSNGLLIRMGELGSDDAIKLLIRSLDVKRSISSPRDMAAAAACRASAEAWPTLEPVVLARLNRETRDDLYDEESALLLALVRFGKKSQALDIIKKRNMRNSAHLIDRLNRLEPNFDPKHCRDRL